ncbi:short-chain dehydrogenase/reductase family 16C member 6-like [Sycon ciliatum]|uniref:short-chain dehydrogenase/reductase family 16C member 6-like n=1 Tax=Sycon ciliatum TaxID=27933 RepID=UPI0031F6C841
MPSAITGYLSEAVQFACGTLSVLWCLTMSLLYWFFNWFVGTLRLSTSTNLNGDVVVITGAGTGLGQEVALQLAAKGCRLVLLGKVKNDLARTMELLKANGVAESDVYTYGCDCSQEDCIRQTVEQIKTDLHGKVTVLVNNAGVVHPDHLDRLLSSDVHDTISTNLLSHFWFTQALLPTLKRQPRAHIVCIGSVAGLFGASGLSSYCASKFGVVGLCESLAMDLHRQGQHHVKVTCICPYHISTKMFQGVELRFPWLFPVLDVRYVGRRIVNCLFSERHLLVMPRTMYLLSFAKTILPYTVMLKAADFLGITTAMESIETAAAAGRKYD